MLSGAYRPIDTMSELAVSRWAIICNYPEWDNLFERWSTNMAEWLRLDRDSPLA